MTDRLSVLIVDDEGLARDRLHTLLLQMPHVRIAGEVSGGAAALRAIADLRPDLVFLDVRMPEVNGFSVLRGLPPDCHPQIIFVTAHAQHAVEAFETQAVDYLLKPFSRQRLLSAVERAWARRSELRPAAPRIALQTGRSVLFLRLAEIDWVEAANNYACVHCGSQTHIVRETLRSLEARLGAARFARIHRSAIVNVERIRELVPLHSGDHRVVLDTGVELTLSRTHGDRLSALLYKHDPPQA